MSRYEILDGYILNIIQSHKIREQSELQQKLKERGQDIPQATLSRHLKRLKIAKVSGIYKIFDYNTPTLPLVLNVQVSEFGLIIMQTHPGNAGSLAYWLDRKYVSYSPQEPKKFGILGTIAGDDTVVLIMKTKSDVDKVLQLLQKSFPYLQL